MKKIILFGFIFLFAQLTHSEDLESGVRDYSKTGDWNDFKIADGPFGRIAATRAATEDKRTNATLAFTYPTNDKCKLAPVELIYKQKSPSEDDSENNIYGNVQIDSGEFKRIEAKLIEQKGNEFIFIVIEGKGFDNFVKNGKILTVNFKGFGVNEFSLDGAKAALDSAKSECKNFDFS